MWKNFAAQNFDFIEKILLTSKGIGTLTNKQMAFERNR